ncbi:MAG: hypothetical protein M3384_05435 [Acidobacteriota bacterium]|nr:hypothetical protein [Acidobacteriota bacterium]
MNGKILIVEDSFLIRRRGVVIVARRTPDFIDFKVGDSIEIENPDKTIVVSKVSGMEFLSGKSFEDKKISFLAEDLTRKDQVQKNAGIRLLENRS